MKEAVAALTAVYARLNQNKVRNQMSVLCVQFVMLAIVYSCCASVSKPWLLQTRNVIFGGQG